MMGRWEKRVYLLAGILANLSITDGTGKNIEKDDGFEIWKGMARQLRAKGRTIFLIGNGASASMASHMATDLSKNAGIRALVFSDSALISALGNDLSFDEIYSEPLNWYMRRNDMLVSISSSGNSPNIIQAIKMGKSLGGKVVTLSAMGEDNAIRGIGDLNFYIPAKTYGMAETGHAAVLHYWIDLLVSSD